MTVRTTSLVAAALFATAALPAAAESFSASTSPGFVGAGICTGTPSATNVSAPVSATILCSDSDGTKSAIASATPGQGHAFAQSNGFSNNANADARYTGVVTFNSATPHDTMVQFVIPLSGLLAADIGAMDPNHDPSFGRSATAGVHASLTIDNPLFGFQTFGFDEVFTTNDTGTHDISGFSTFTASAPNALGAVDLILTSSAILVPVNTSIVYSLDVVASASSFSFNGSALADFSDTFGFKVGQPAPFILQDGVTANSGNFIVNNVVVDPNASVPGGVPEPASWALMLVGFGGLGAALRRAREKALRPA